MTPFPIILLIDDDEITNYLNSEIITSMGIAIQIYTATNGNKGLQLVKELCQPTVAHCPNLILLDINMPDIDGFEFLKELEQLEDIYLNIKVIMLTSSSNKYDVGRANEFNLLDFITKPLTREKLSNSLSKIQV